MYRIGFAEGPAEVGHVAVHAALNDWQQMPGQQAHCSVKHHICSRYQEIEIKKQECEFKDATI